MDQEQSPIEYKALIGEEIEHALLPGVLELHARIFGRHDGEGIREEIKRKYAATIFLAVRGKTVLGYKIGYERKPGHYYSWVGGVDASARNLGIGTELLRRQHEWCRAHNYKTIRTTSKNKWREMMVLNLRHGFDIIGCFVDNHGDPKIMMDKRFTQ